MEEGDIMDWDEAKRAISKKVTTGTDINTEESTNREILAANDHCPWQGTHDCHLHGNMTRSMSS